MYIAILKISGRVHYASDNRAEIIDAIAHMPEAYSIEWV